ncbi:hypothetical protein AB0I81_52450 [Nonomuraea sp. NPDC050404]|uniref:hypothetical protein n=1 Tax=Nonomuraea sp. NPDC050404 TaxID=3155783 RepID=UPI0033DE62DC
MPAWRLRGVILPDDEPGDVYVGGDRITFTPVPGAETAAEEARASGGRSADRASDDAEKRMNLAGFGARLGS